MIDIKQLNSSDNDFWPQLEAILAWESVSDNAIGETVKNILTQVKSKGDDAVLEFTRRFDRAERHVFVDYSVVNQSVDLRLQEMWKDRDLAKPREPCERAVS